MTQKRDFDRLARAWLDLMPSEAPDRVVNAVLQAVEAAPQRRPSVRTTIWRFPHMNRISIAVAAAMIVVAIAGGAAMLSRSTPDRVGAPTPAVSPTAGPSLTDRPSPAPTPLVSGLGRGLGLPLALPAAMRGQWVADSSASAAPDSAGTRPRMTISSDGNTVSVSSDGTKIAFYGQPVTSAPNAVWIALRGVGQPCNALGLGQYAQRLSSDGLTLTLTAVSDPCPARSDALARTWVRAVDLESGGGRGVMAQFTPAFLITLPTAAYTANSGDQSVNVTAQSLDRTLIAVRDPMGWTRPCSSTGGTKTRLTSTSAAFVAYLRSIPGFTVQTSPLQIDGRPALRLLVPTAEGPACPASALHQGQVIEWGTPVAGDTGYWFISQGDTDVIYLVDVGTDVYLLQWLGAGVTAAEEQSVLSTIHFIDRLPAGAP